MNKNYLNYLIYGIAAIAFGAAGAGCQQSKSPEAAKPAAAAPASGPVADLFLQQLNDDKGVKQALSQWQGKHLIVNFWAPWCGPCVEEMPELSRLQGEVAAKNVQVLGIGIDSPGNIATFAGKNPVSYPLYVAGMGGTELAGKLGNSAGGLPYTVLIGADGQVIKTYVGKLKFDELRADLARL